MSSKKIRIQVEGNRGSGKSLFAKMLQKVLTEEYEIDSEVYHLPVFELSKNDLLKNAIECPLAYYFQLETKTVMSLFKQRRVQTKPVSIYDGSLWSTRNVFRSLYSDDRKIISLDEFQTLDLLHEALSKEKPHLSNPTVIIYLEVPPKLCHERIWKRTEEDLCDKEEDRALSLARLMKIEEQYEKAFETCNAKKILRLDGTLEPLTLARAAANVLTSPAVKQFQLFYK